MNRRARGRALALVAALAAAGYGAARVAADPAGTTQTAVTATSSGPSATVGRIVDGDTVEIGATTVRIIGVNTPELRPAECFGKEATEFTRRLVEGKAVRVVNDPTQGATDRYGRTLAYLEVDGRDVGMELVAAGFAKPYRLASGKEPTRYKAYVAAAATAADARLGMHGSCQP